MKFFFNHTPKPSKLFAKENGMKFYQNIVGDDTKNSSSTLISCFINDTVVPLFPPNDGMAGGKAEFVKEIDGQEVVVLSNLEGFQSIENLPEILIKMVDLYDKTLEDPTIFINPFQFGLKLKSDVVQNYQGEATLVVCEHTLLKDVNAVEIHYTKKWCINYFLDGFMSNNFGKVIKGNAELKAKLMAFNNKVIKHGLRERIEFDPENIWFNKWIVPFKLSIS